MALVVGVKYGLLAADNNSSPVPSFLPHPGSQGTRSQPTGPTRPTATTNGGGGETGGGSSSGKSVVFVKLTDSALKAIEDYLRSQVSQLAYAKINSNPSFLRKLAKSERKT